MPTVASLSAALQAQIAPGNDAEFLRLLTEADLRLLEFGRWRWTRGRVELTPSSGLVTLPADEASILAARFDAWPVDVEDEFLEFVPGGPGEIEVGGGVAARLIDQGLDDNGARYYKCVGMSAEDDWTVYAITHHAPYTLYDLLPGARDDTPAATDSDTTRCPSQAALKLMMLGIIFEEGNDPGSARSYISDALKVLDNHGKAQRGGARTRPAVRQNNGLGGIRSFR